MMEFANTARVKKSRSSFRAPPSEIEIKRELDKE